MKLTGKEDASWCVEQDGKPYFTVCQLNWEQLLNYFISDKVWNESKLGREIEEFDTRYICFNKLKIPKEVKIKMAFQISTKATPSIVLEDECELTFKVKNFHNAMIKTITDFAKKYNTTLWNIGFKLRKLEILEGKPFTKIKVFSSDNSNFDDYIDILKKYSSDSDELTIKKDEDYGYYYVDLDVRSFNFLPKLEQELAECKIAFRGLIFSTIEEGYYQLEIYDGYIE